MIEGLVLSLLFEGPSETSRRGTYDQEARQVDVHPSEGVHNRGASQLRVAQMQRVSPVNEGEHQYRGDI